MQILYCLDFQKIYSLYLFSFKHQRKFFDKQIGHYKRFKLRETARNYLTESLT